MGQHASLATALLCATSLAGLADVRSARAQSAPEPSASVDEVVVTARRREERLIDVPVAVTAMSRERIDRFAATDLIKIAELAPNVAITPSGNGSGASIRIRGIGSTAADAGVEQTVTIQIDGVPIGRGRIINVAQFDLRSVEVLKGPQALFFGKNSPGGVIALNSTDPSGSFEGYVRAGYQTRSEMRFIEGALSLPITEDLAARLALRADSSHGFIRNTARPIASPFQPGVILPGRAAEHGTYENVVGRLTVQWEPTERFDATLKVLAARSLSANGVPGETVCRVSPFVTSVGMRDPFSDCKIDWKTSLGTIPAVMANGWPASKGGKPWTDVRSRLYGLTMNYEADNIDFTSVTSFYKFSSENWAPLAGSVSAFFAGSNDEWNTTVTQELRANSRFEGPLNFTAGLFFEDGDRRFQNTSELSPLPPDPQGRTYTDQVDFQTDSRAYSAFGQLRWDITDTVELAGGARWTREEKKGFLGNTFVNVNTRVPLLPQGTFIPQNITDEAVTPEVTLTWKPSPNLTIYGAYKTGYKSPGFTNTIVIPITYNENNTRFAAEHSKGFEAGVKFSLFDGRLSGDVTAFRYDFEDLQVVSFNSATITYQVQNAAEARTQGLETQLAWRATDQLRLYGDLSLLDAKYVSFPSTNCYVGQTAAQGCSPTGQNASGRDLPGAPEVSGRLGFSYEQPIAAGFNLDLDGDLNFSGRYAASLTYAPFTYQKAFAYLNLSARLTREGEPWELAIIGRNLTNEAHIISAGDIPGGSLGDIGVTTNDPRSFTFQLTYRF